MAHKTLLLAYRFIKLMLLTFNQSLDLAKFFFGLLAGQLPKEKHKTVVYSIIHPFDASFIT